MFENSDQLIDKNLKIMAGYKGGMLFTHHNFKKLNGGSLSLKEQKELAKIMQVQGLLVINCGNDLIVDITKNGRMIYENGGWLKHKATQNLLEQKEALEKKKRETIEILETEKLKDDAKISKLNAKYRYVPYVVSILGFVIACLAYFKPVDKSDNTQLSKDEIIHIADSILTSKETKKDNPLDNTKTESDSLAISN